MHDYTQEIESFSFGETTVQLWIPTLDKLRTSVEKEKDAATFPFWAKLWPSAIALCRFIAENPALVTRKNVLELAAGLGLPGIFAAQYAHEVVISDYVPDAVAFMQSSVDLNALNNILCRELDWYNLPADLSPDVLLLSDINYDPSAFEVLHTVLIDFLDKGTTIILTTPQRLMAKPFIERLLPYCMQKTEFEIMLRSERTYISVLVLRKVAE